MSANPSSSSSNKRRAPNDDNDTTDNNAKRIKDMPRQDTLAPATSFEVLRKECPAIFSLAKKNHPTFHEYPVVSAFVNTSSRDDWQLVVCSFDPSSQCASITLENPDRPNYGLRVYGSNIAIPIQNAATGITKSGLQIERCSRPADDKARSMGWPDVVLKKSEPGQHYIVKISCTLNNSTPAPILLGYHSDQIEEDEFYDVIDKIASDPKDMTVFLIYKSLNINERKAQGDSHQAWVAAMKMCSRYSLQWYYTLTNGFTDSPQMMASWKHDREPDRVNEDVGYPPWMIRERHEILGELVGKSTASFDVQTSFQSITHWTSVMVFAAMRESAAGAASLRNAYTAKDNHQAVIERVTVDGKPVAGSYIVNIKIAALSEVIEQTPEAGDRVEITISGTAGDNEDNKPVKGLIMKDTTDGFDLSVSVSKAWPFNNVPTGKTVWLSSLSPVLPDPSTARQIQACQDMLSGYSRPKGCALDMHRVLRNNQPADSNDCYVMLTDDNTDDQRLAFNAAVKYWTGKLDDGQNASIQKSIICVGGIHITQGPPGTSKTTTSVALIDLAKIAGHKMLFTGPTNTSVNIPMEKIADFQPESRFEDLGMLRWTSTYITRTQEEQLFKAMEDSGDMEAEERLTQAYNALEVEFEEAKKVLNIRGKDYTMIAWKVKLIREAQQPTASPSLKDIVARWETARAAYIPQIGNLKGNELKKAKEDWGRADRALITEIMQRIDIVFVTCNMSRHEDLVDLFQPDILIVDEAGQATEPDIVIPMIAHHSTIEAMFLYGDHKQLRPVVLTTTTQTNEYCNQLVISPFERWVKCGYNEFTMLTKCWRFSHHLTAFPSKRWYNDQFESALDANESPPVLQQLQRWSATMFKTNIFKSRRVLFDTSHTMSVRLDGGSSSVNSREAVAVISTCLSLFADPLARSRVLVLTPYKAQLRELQRLRAAQPALHDVDLTIATFNDCQDKEGDVVLLSFVRHDQDHPEQCAFIADANRLCVAITRMKIAVIMFGAWETFMGLRQLLKSRPQTKDFAELVGNCYYRGNVYLLPTCFRTLLPGQPSSDKLLTIGEQPKSTLPTLAMRTGPPNRSTHPRSNPPQDRPAPPRSDPPHQNRQYKAAPAVQRAFPPSSMPAKTTPQPPQTSAGVGVPATGGPVNAPQAVVTPQPIQAPAGFTTTASGLHAVPLQAPVIPQQLVAAQPFSAQPVQVPVPGPSSSLTNLQQNHIIALYQEVNTLQGRIARLEAYIRQFGGDPSQIP